jgi:tetratricopeptide (TPR) repeat protein
MRLLKEVRNLMANYHVKSGIYHYYRNEFKQAVEFFRKALRDEPNLTDSDRRITRYYLTQTFMNSAEKLVKKGDLEAAAHDYLRASEVNPEWPDIRFHLGKVLERLERYDEAIEHYRQAIAVHETYLDARVALAFSLLRAGRDEEAAAAFSDAMELKVRKIREPYEKGVQRLREGMVSEAEEFFHEAFLSDPIRFEEHYHAALEHLKAEEYEKALDQLERSLSLCPKYADLHNFRGVALCELGRTDEGIAAFRRSAALNPDYLVPRINLAFAQLRAGMFKEAETQLEAVLEQDPTQPAASIKLEELRTGRIPEVRRGATRGTAR